MIYNKTYTKNKTKIISVLEDARKAQWHESTG